MKLWKYEIENRRSTDTFVCMADTHKEAVNKVGTHILRTWGLYDMLVFSKREDHVEEVTDPVMHIVGTIVQ